MSALEPDVDTVAPEPAAPDPIESAPRREAGVPDDFISPDLEAAEPEEPQAQPASDPAIEAEARKYGWKPPSDWKGKAPATGFLSAADYMQTNAVLRKQIEELRGQVGKVSEVEQRQQQLERSSVENQVRSAYRQLNASYDRAMQEAVQASDVELYNELRAEYADRRAKLDDAVRQRFAAPPAPAPAPEPVVRWVEKYGSELDTYRAADPVEFDGAMARYAVEAERMYGQDFAARGDYLITKARERWSAGQVKPQTQPNRAPMVESGARRAPAYGGERGYIHMPAEARTAYQDFVKAGAFKDTPKQRAEYAADYWSQFE